MAATKKRKKETTRLIHIKRHLAGPPRRSPGQRLLLTPTQITQQRLRVGLDFVYVNADGSLPPPRIDDVIGRPDDRAMDPSPRGR